MRDFVFRLFLLVLPIALFGLLAGCGSSNSAYVKTINVALVPQAGGSRMPLAVNVTIGKTVAAQNLSFGGATSSYAQIPTGKSVVQVTSTIGNPATETAVLSSNHYYTALAMSNNTAVLSARFFDDDLTPPASGDFKLRVMHFADAAGSVDIYVTAPDVVIDDPKHPVEPTLSNFPVDGVSAYLQVPAGTYRFRVTAPGDPSNPIIDTGSSEPPLAAGNIYTAVTLDPHNAPCTPSGACPALVVGYSIFLTQDQPVPGVTPVAPATVSTK
jgi:hypothetical protein